MADLIAQAAEGDHGWRRILPKEPVTLGRTEKSSWQADWDNSISGLHAVLTWKDGQLSVRKHAAAKNQIFFRGKPNEDFALTIGEYFVIGVTTFTLHESETASCEELTCSQLELEQVKFVDPDQRIEALTALPEMLRHYPTDEEFESRVVEVLLKGVPRALVAAIVRLDPPNPPSREEALVQVRRRDQRGTSAIEFRPSRKLVYDAVCHLRQSVMHSWLADQGAEYTVSAHEDWAICVPLRAERSLGWGLYVTGRHSEPLDTDGATRRQLQESDLKFVSLVAEIFATLREVRDLQKKGEVLSTFFSPLVLNAIAEKDKDELDQVLNAREAEITVLFCDLRGSCRIAEEAAPLVNVCERLSDALGIMTANINAMLGVVGDFQGDAAMGFWGWPFAGEDHIERAAQAALAIRREFLQCARKKNHSLAGISCGIGIASGTGIAGRLGTLEQSKISVFGPVVNLASRLESMTKKFQVAVVLDDRVSERLKAVRCHWARCRRLALVQPFGMTKSLLVSELLPPTGEPGAMRESDRLDYETALGHFMNKRWKEAYQLLDRLPTDGPSQLLKAFMDRHDRRPPENWTGVMLMESK